MPYLIKDRAHFERFLDKVFWTDIAPKAEAKGYKIIAVYKTDPPHHKQQTSYQYAGRSQSHQDPYSARRRRQKMFEAYGASPAPLEFNELFVALQTGVMDGQENPCRTSGVENSMTFKSPDDYQPRAHVVLLTTGWNVGTSCQPISGLRFEKIARETQHWAFLTAPRRKILRFWRN